jgi:hypothetical protein
MTKATAEVLLWAQRIAMRKKPRPFELLELTPDCTLEQAQEAFHRIARMAHPDLYRTTLNADELERVTSAYALVAAAYQTIRSQRMRAGAIQRSNAKSGSQPVVSSRDFNDEPPTPPPVVPPPPPMVDSRPPPAVTPAIAQMNPKAQLYYRKAELSLRRGDLSGAMLHLKMAIGADPSSTFLRAALLEVQTEASGKKS